MVKLGTPELLPPSTFFSLLSSVVDHIHVEMGIVTVASHCKFFYANLLLLPFVLFDRSNIFQVIYVCLQSDSSLLTNFGS